MDPCGPTLDCPDGEVEGYQCSRKGVSICTCQDIAGSLTFGESCVVPLEKGKSEGIGFDPRAFELDEEENMDFQMSMSMRVVDIDIVEDDVEKDEVAEESVESTTADDNLEAAKSFWGW